MKKYKFLRGSEVKDKVGLWVCAIWSNWKAYELTSQEWEDFIGPAYIQRLLKQNHKVYLQSKIYTEYGDIDINDNSQVLILKSELYKHSCRLKDILV